MNFAQFSDEIDLRIFDAASKMAFSVAAGRQQATRWWRQSSDRLRVARITNPQLFDQTCMIGAALVAELVSSWIRRPH